MSRPPPPYTHLRSLQASELCFLLGGNPSLGSSQEFRPPSIVSSMATWVEEGGWLGPFVGDTYRV